MVEQVNQSVFEDLLQKNQIVVADFFAVWCGPCKMMHPIFERVAQNNPKTTFVRIDVDEEYELAEKYQVQSIPTIIIYKNGKEFGRKVGFMGQEDFELFVASAN